MLCTTVVCLCVAGRWEHSLLRAERWETLPELPDRVQVSAATERPRWDQPSSDLTCVSTCSNTLDVSSGVMPKRGLNVNACELYRFYRLICVKDLVEPLSMIVPRKEVSSTRLYDFLSLHSSLKRSSVCLQPSVFQEDLYPMTPANQAAMTAQEWLSGVNRGQLKKK